MASPALPLPFPATASATKADDEQEVSRTDGRTRGESNRTVAQMVKHDVWCGEKRLAPLAGFRIRKMDGCAMPPDTRLASQCSACAIRT